MRDRIIKMLMSTAILFYFSTHLFAKIDYSQLSPDSPEVEQASHTAVEQLGEDNGAVKFSGTVVEITPTVIDIIGIPSGLDESGVAIKSQIEDLESALRDLAAKVTETEISFLLFQVSFYQPAVGQYRRSSFCNADAQQLPLIHSA